MTHTTTAKNTEMDRTIEEATTTEETKTEVEDKDTIIKIKIIMRKKMTNQKFIEMKRNNKVNMTEIKDIIRVKTIQEVVKTIQEVVIGATNLKEEVINTEIELI